MKEIFITFFVWILFCFTQYKDKVGVKNVWHY